MDAPDDPVAQLADLGIRGWVELVKGERTVLVGGEDSVGQEGVEVDVEILMITPSRWTLTESSREVRLPAGCP